MSGRLCGFLQTCDGQVWSLPVLLAWQLRHTDGTACDSFSVEFPWQASYLEALHGAVRFWAQFGGETVFTGVVDEYQVTLGPEGLTALVTGRGLAALLMDNQVVAAEYETAQLADILSAYVTPFGITANAAAMGSVNQFAVSSGNTCWTALCGFCIHAAGVQPRFLPDGTLLLRGDIAAAGVSISDYTPLLQAVWRECRYGVYSEVDTVNRSTGEVTRTENETFAALGGQSRQIVTVAASGALRASSRTAGQLIESSMAEWRLLEVTLPGAFLAWPGSAAEISLSSLGLQGSGLVTEAASQLDADGLRCTLSIRID